MAEDALLGGIGNVFNQFGNDIARMMFGNSPARGPAQPQLPIPRIRPRPQPGQPQPQSVPNPEFQRALAFLDENSPEKSHERWKEIEGRLQKTFSAIMGMQGGGPAQQRQCRFCLNRQAFGSLTDEKLYLLAAGQQIDNGQLSLLGCDCDWEVKFRPSENATYTEVQTPEMAWRKSLEVVQSAKQHWASSKQEVKEKKVARQKIERKISEVRQKRKEEPAPAKESAAKPKPAEEEDPDLKELERQLALSKEEEEKAELKAKETAGAVNRAEGEAKAAEAKVKEASGQAAP